jgi:hypothetical protein
VRVSLGRILAVTVGLSLTGAVCGAVLGGLSFLVALAADKGFGALRDWSIVFVLGAYGGAVFGAVLAPLLAWIFLRRVSLARAIGQTALGVIIGVVVAAVVRPELVVIFGLAGFVLAAIWLWVSTRRTPPTVSNAPFSER